MNKKLGEYQCKNEWKNQQDKCSSPSSISRQNRYYVTISKIIVAKDDNEIRTKVNNILKLDNTVYEASIFRTI